MDYTLPETLQSIIGTICMKNLFKGYKIYSEGGRTNIVIQFVECKVQPCSPNLQSSTSEFQANEQLKPAVCSPKHRSTSNRARDLRRVQCHRIEGQNGQLFSEKSMQSPNHMDLQFDSQTDCKQNSEELSKRYVFSPDSGVNETQHSFVNPVDNHDEEYCTNVETESETESKDCNTSETVNKCKQLDGSEDWPPYADAILATIKAACAALRAPRECDEDIIMDDSNPTCTTATLDAEPNDNVT